MAKLIGVAGLVAAILTWSTAHGGADDGVPRKGKIDVNAVFKKLDANKDGKLNREEFVKMADRAKDNVKDKVRDRLGKVYDKLDPEKSGLSKDQFKTFLEMKRKDTP